LGLVLLSIKVLMDEPNPEDPMNSKAAQEYVKDRNKFNTMASDFTMRHASTSHNTQYAIPRAITDAPSVSFELIRSDFL
jgi:hypothetical protein